MKTAQTFPEGMAVLEGEKCVSYDGDADRIVYFFEEGEWQQSLPSPSSLNFIR